MSGEQRRALVASDSVIGNDPRVIKQIQWLVAAGWTVDTLGRAEGATEANGAHYSMPRRPFAVRQLANTLMPRAARYRALVESCIPEPLRSGLPSTKYSLIIVNEIELLPWLVKVHHSLLSEHGMIHLDLHEYAPSQGSGLVYRLLFSRYRLWQTSFIASAIFTSRSTVSPGVARLYSTRLDIPLPSVVRSCPSFVDQAPSTTAPNDIALVHHGSASRVRGLHTMIDAMHDIDDRFTLHLMLVGRPAAIRALQKQAAPLRERVVFHAPVGVRDVAARLNEFDLEIIFFPPVTENLRYALPNKLFEAIQGRLGIITGESPDMAALVAETGNGTTVSGWTSDDLARTINGLSVDDVRRFKENSHAAAAELSAERESERFLAQL